RNELLRSSGIVESLAGRSGGRSARVLQSPTSGEPPIRCVGAGSKLVHRTEIPTLAKCEASARPQERGKPLNPARSSWVKKCTSLRSRGSRSCRRRIDFPPKRGNKGQQESVYPGLTGFRAWS